MNAQLVADALVMAIWRRGKPDALLHHSDQGSQYTSQQFQTLMSDNGVTCSMSRSGNVWDNAAMESFFSSLKTERVRRQVYRTRDAARADVFDYIERFYNTTRRHSTIGYHSPVEFEAAGRNSLRRCLPNRQQASLQDPASLRGTAPLARGATDAQLRRARCSRRIEISRLPKCGCRCCVWSRSWRKARVPPDLKSRRYKCGLCQDRLTISRSKHMPVCAFFYVSRLSVASGGLSPARPSTGNPRQRAVLIMWWPILRRSRAMMTSSALEVVSASL